MLTILRKHYFGLDRVSIAALVAWRGRSLAPCHNTVSPLALAVQELRMAKQLATTRIRGRHPVAERRVGD